MFIVYNLDHSWYRTTLYLSFSMAQRRVIRGCNVFNDQWLKDSEFSEWLTRTTNTSYAGCTACGINDISISALGRSALTSHAKVSGRLLTDGII